MPGPPQRILTSDDTALLNSSDRSKDPLFEGTRYDLIILYSGGADSRLILEFALKLNRAPLCVMVDYGQDHGRELSYARQQLNDLGVAYKTVKINGLDLNSGLTGGEEGRWDNVHEMNVPGRNTIFISLAYSIAENEGITEIWYGPDYSDRVNLFPDCYQEYVVKMNEVLAISGVRPIELKAPLLGWTKEMIVEYLTKVCKVNMEDVYSGYEEPEKSDNGIPTELDLRSI